MEANDRANGTEVDSKDASKGLERWNARVASVVAKNILPAPSPKRIASLPLKLGSAGTQPVPTRGWNFRARSVNARNTLTMVPKKTINARLSLMDRSAGMGSATTREARKLQ